MKLADLEPALGNRPLVTMDDLAKAVQSGFGHVLTTPRSAIFVRVESFLTVGERVATVGPAVGNLAEIIEALPHLEQWARFEGCTQAHVIGRKGWERALKAHGYEHYETVTRKLLDQ